VHFRLTPAVLETSGPIPLTLLKLALGVRRARGSRLAHPARSGSGPRHPGAAIIGFCMRKIDVGQSSQSVVKASGQRRLANRTD